MAWFLADLPSSDPQNFSQLPEKELKANRNQGLDYNKDDGNVSVLCTMLTEHYQTGHDISKVPKIAYHVPRRDNEKTIANDKKPYILRFLERQWAVRKEEGKESHEESSTVRKKRKSDVMKKRTSTSDVPSTSSGPKTRRLS
ncbi:hypothetical protein DICVIV_07253 [Dictyocaulus viviparus]|uniref:DET1- and DDB1-associated protein 1 N-terminal domain-containing protein n=1 Tax=Dictyocaulus viviparus TaxID=29172 RepID=A0A0D8XSH4_DICVI|nr:hypothetical protein DICVIV_07253 [Dictyocaulus viviparus]